MPLMSAFTCMSEVQNTETDFKMLFLVLCIFHFWLIRLLIFSADMQGDKVFSQLILYFMDVWMLIFFSHFI